MSKPKELQPKQREELLKTLETRFMENMARHEGLEWAKIKAKLEAEPGKLWSLWEMERTGGEPDVVGFDEDSGEYIFVDCSPQTPKGRLNTVYDRMAQAEREKKKVFPAGNVLDMAEAMGITVLSEEQYRDLQLLGEFDTKTSSWVLTPKKIRDLGGAIFMDRRYDTVFVFHNSAPSFYSSRGFRGLLRV